MEKKIKIILCSFFVILLLGGMYSYVSYKDSSYGFEELNVKAYSEDGVEFYVDSDGIYYCPNGKIMPENGICGKEIGFINPRDLILNDSDDEVVYRDHTGNIGGLGDIYFNISGSSTGYFNYLGSSLTKVTSGWFSFLQADNINSTTANATEFYQGGNLVLDSNDISVLNQTSFALSINTTANIQNLLNATGIYSTYNASYFNRLNSINSSFLLANTTAISINTTANVQALINGSSIWLSTLNVTGTSYLDLLSRSCQER